MGMTRKDYEMLADALRGALLATTHNDQAVGILRASRHVAATLGADNSRFDQDLFMKAVEKPDSTQDPIGLNDVCL